MNSPVNTLPSGKTTNTTQRTIFHVDVNSAYLSWSALKQLRLSPGSVDLRTVPSAVGGDVKTRHGIITAKSIPAKKYGIGTDEIEKEALHLAKSLLTGPDGLFTKGISVRLIGVGVSKLSEKKVQQLNLFDWAEQNQAEEEKEKEQELEKQKQEKQARLDSMLKEINDRYGKGALTLGKTLL